MSSNKRNAGLKPFTIISGEPRKIDCYLHDLSQSLYWAKSKDALLEHFLRTKDRELQAMPFSYDYSNNSPSPYHLVLCDTESCPCSKYVMCCDCYCTKEAVPKEGVTIEFDGRKETLAYESNEEASCCKCTKPRFQGKLELCQEAIDTNDSDYCYKLIELRIADSIQVHADDDDGEPKKKVSKNSNAGGESD